MTGKTHLAGGALAGLTIATIALQDDLPNQIEFPYNIICIPGIILASLLGSVFPDIDWHTSKVGAILKPISRIINMVFGHRTLFHSPILYILIYFALSCDLPNLYWANFSFVIGAATHLLLDMFNKKGISLFYPNQKRFHILDIDSNSTAETVIRMFLMSMVFVAFIPFSVAIFHFAKR